jgi:hypothetical protein
MRSSRLFRYISLESFLRLAYVASFRAVVKGGVLLTSLCLLFACAHYPVNPKLCEDT